ncbi:MAG: hypothetical protein R2747_23635 [Pyrinomonadaceae bacterium]
MEIAFDAIGIEISNKNVFKTLAEDVGRRGELSLLRRKSGILHGRCLKLGAGLEIWNVLYESGTGEVFAPNFRPGFRARFAQKISPWVLTEFDEEGEAVIHGFIEDSETEVLFELQNLTEVGTAILNRNTLRVGLGGLAYRAEVFRGGKEMFWRSYDEITLNVIANENIWSLGGRILAFNSFQNPLSGNDLYWLYLDTGRLKLEILASRRLLKGDELRVGSFIKADIWLQGHILNKFDLGTTYEGVDPSFRTVDFWKKFKRPN